MLIDYKTVIEQFCLDVEKTTLPIKVIIPGVVLAELDGCVILIIAPGPFHTNSNTNVHWLGAGGDTGSRMNKGSSGSLARRRPGSW